MRSLLAVCTLLALAGASSTQANEWHVCQFDQDEKVLSYTLPEGDEDAVRAACINAAMLRMEWRYRGAGGHYPRGVLTVRGPSEALAIEGAVQTERDGRQALTISINTNSALVRLIRRADVEVRYPGGGYRMQADKTGCIEALLTACILSRPTVRTTHAEPD